jgi:hypothetical protein
MKMKKFLATAGTVALLALTSAPAIAATPATQATATARIYKPLSISRVQSLDFGTIVLNNTAFAGEVVSMNLAGTVSCGGGVNMTCSGTPQTARYNLVGSNNAEVTVTSPGFNLVNGAANIAFTPTFNATVNLGATGTTDFDIGGSITVAGATPEGVYTGNFLVTANYK